MDHTRQQHFIRTSLCWLLVLLWSLLAVKYVLPATLPFWIGLAVAYLLKPLTLWLSSHLKFRRKSVAFSVLLLFYLLLGTLLWILGSVAFQQCSNWIRDLPGLYSNHVQPFLHRCALTVNGVLDNFSPKTAQMLVEKSAELTNTLSTSLASFSADALSQATSVAKKIPFWLTTVAFAILCSVFISMDYSSVVQFLLKQLPPRLRPVLLRCKNFLTGSLFCMMKAYLILLVITFIQLLIGFWLLKIDQPLLWAAVLALLDFLPFIGTGLILVPWGLYQLISGQTALGAGLLILFAILTVVHNLMEPKLVSSSIGLHPLVTLVAMYAGLRLFGFTGLLVAPVLVLLLCFLQEEGIVKLFH
ncbi:MAG: sporulation integral membrane protein YtvI [Oscillospiraceae bacterium]|nr:sporulation integral membrane protein YtvI [Oscillospiraceae bacterium]